VRPELSSRLWDIYKQRVGICVFLLSTAAAFSTVCCLHSSIGYVPPTEFEDNVLKRKPPDRPLLNL